MIILFITFVDNKKESYIKQKMCLMARNKNVLYNSKCTRVLIT